MLQHLSWSQGSRFWHRLWSKYCWDSIPAPHPTLTAGIVILRGMLSRLSQLAADGCASRASQPALTQVARWYSQIAQREEGLVYEGPFGGAVRRLKVGVGVSRRRRGRGGGRLQAALCRAGSVESSRGALLLRIGSATSMWHLLKPISCPSAPCATLAAAAEAEPFQCRVCFGGGPHHSRPGHPHSAARQALHCCHAVDIWLVYDWPYGRGGRCWPCGYQEQLCATPGWR